MAHADRVQRARALIKEHVRKDMPEEIKRLARGAYADLHFGPVHNDIPDEEAERFPGFETATTSVAAWLRDHMSSEVWVDLDCEMVWDKELEGYYDGDEWIAPDTEHVYHFDRLAILGAAFGDLGEYLR